LNPFAWMLSKIDKKQKFQKMREGLSKVVNKRPWLKTLATIALVAYTVFNVVMQIISFPVFGAGMTRKNTDLKEDYARAAVCLEKARNGESCTPAEVLSVKKAWDNDLMTCFGHGAAFLAERAANPLVPPKAAPATEPVKNFQGTFRVAQLNLR